MTNTKQLPFATNFRNALLEISSKLQPETYALTGGLAVAHWIQDRKTEDLDFALAAQDITRLKKLFPRCIGEGPAIYNVEINSVSVDFLKPASYPWNEEAIRNSRKSLIEGVLLPVVTPEYLIVYKMHAEREKDEEDIRRLLRLSDVYKTARSLVERYLSSQHAEELDQLAQLAALP